MQILECTLIPIQFDSATIDVDTHKGTDQEHILPDLRAIQMS